VWGHWSDLLHVDGFRSRKWEHLFHIVTTSPPLFLLALPENAKTRQEVIRLTESPPAIAGTGFQARINFKKSQNTTDHNGDPSVCDFIRLHSYQTHQGCQEDNEGAVIAYQPMPSYGFSNNNGLNGL